MKNQIMLLSLVCMTLLYGCGGSSTTSGSSTSALSTTPVVQNGLSSVSAPANFIGTWTGYLNDSYTSILIQPNGSITINQVGQSVMQRILYLQNSSYYIVNTETKTGVAVRSNGTTLTVTLAGVDETFYKN